MHKSLIAVAFSSSAVKKILNLMILSQELNSKKSNRKVICTVINN